MDWETIEAALEKWFKLATGLSRVIWDGQKAPMNERPYGELRIFATQGVGEDERRTSYDSTQAAGREMVREVCGHRLFTLGCKVRSRDNRPSKAAQAFLEKARTSLIKLSTLDIFKGAELAVVGAEPLVSLPGTFQGREESFASMDVRFCTVVNETDPREQGGYIETIEVTSDFIDVDGNSLPSKLQLVAEQMPE